MWTARVRSNDDKIPEPNHFVLLVPRNWSTGISKLSDDVINDDNVPDDSANPQLSDTDQQGWHQVIRKKHTPKRDAMTATMSAVSSGGPHEPADNQPLAGSPAQCEIIGDVNLSEEATTPAGADTVGNQLGSSRRPPPNDVTDNQSVVDCTVEQAGNSSNDRPPIDVNDTAEIVSSPSPIDSDEKSQHTNSDTIRLVRGHKKGIVLTIGDYVYAKDKNCNGKRYFHSKRHTNIRI